jgi:ribosomal protection tetracycline resistance protein
MAGTKKIINIGIVAHVDAGKTSVTEQFLYKSGVIRNLGSVDKGTSQSDSLAIEKERGISVKSSSASFKWNQIKINLIDTPGHVDFSAEVERSLRALDCAILILSAVEGVQAHAVTIWKALRKMNIPVIIFVNKIDRMGADTTPVIREIKKELTPDIVVMQSVHHEGSNEAMITDISQPASWEKLPEDFIESILNHDESLMHRYLENKPITIPDIRKSLADQILGNTLFPVLLGSAKFDTGIKELLNAITQWMPRANGDNNAPVSGIVYKVSHDKTIGRLASIRLFNGTIQTRDAVFNATQETEEKISQIRQLQGHKQVDKGILFAGDSAVLCGMNRVKAGDIIGKDEGIRMPVKLHAALLTVRVSTATPEDFPALVNALQILTDEDPAMDMNWIKETRELHIKVMGLIQLEILENMLAERFQLTVIFGNPNVVYKETPAAPGEGHEEYTMPKPCWAVVRFKIEPGEPGSGVEYNSLVGVNQIAQRYQNEIKRTIPLALQQGILGWEVTDIKITLIDGEHHTIHSRAGDFAVATPMAIMNGLKAIGTTLLEPMLDFTITGPEDDLGKVISSLTQLRAEIGNPMVSDEKFSLKGTLPVATSLDYAARLSSLTGGKGKLATRFSGYRACPLELGATTPFRGISPLDRSKYILQARKAL